MHPLLVDSCFGAPYEALHRLMVYFSIEHLDLFISFNNLYAECFFKPIVLALFMLLSFCDDFFLPIRFEWLLQTLD